jgi:hypothetical protein
MLPAVATLEFEPSADEVRSALRWVNRTRWSMRVLPMLPPIALSVGVVAYVDPELRAAAAIPLIAGLGFSVVMRVRAVGAAARPAGERRPGEPPTPPCFLAGSCAPMRPDWRAPRASTVAQDSRATRPVGQDSRAPRRRCTGAHSHGLELNRRPRTHAGVPILVHGAPGRGSPCGGSSAGAGCGSWVGGSPGDGACVRLRVPSRLRARSGVRITKSFGAPPTRVAPWRGG